MRMRFRMGGKTWVPQRKAHLPRKLDEDEGDAREEEGHVAVALK